jgi:hypothetical protein
MRRRSRAGGERAKSQRRKAVTPKRRSAPESVGARGSSVAGQETEVARLTRERDEAHEQQKATAEILRVIRTSPADVQPVFETIVRNAVSLSAAAYRPTCSVSMASCCMLSPPTTWLQVRGGIMRIS